MGPGLGQIAQVHKKNLLLFFLNIVIHNFCIFNSSRYHANIQQECGIIVKTIKAEMKSDLIPLAEEKSNHGKVWLKCAMFVLYKLGIESVKFFRVRYILDEFMS